MAAIVLHATMALRVLHLKQAMHVVVPMDLLGIGVTHVSTQACLSVCLSFCLSCLSVCLSVCLCLYLVNNWNSSPCYNEATCIASDTGCACSCANGFTGNRCDTYKYIGVFVYHICLPVCLCLFSVNNLNSFACYNGAMCASDIGYACSCDTCKQTSLSVCLSVSLLCCLFTCLSKFNSVLFYVFYFHFLVYA